MERIRTPFQAFFVAVALILGSYVLGGVAVLSATRVLETVGVQIETRPLLNLLLSTILLQGVSYGGLSLLYLRMHGHGIDYVSVAIPDRRDLVAIIAGIAALRTLEAVASSIVTALELEHAQNTIVETGQQDPTIFLVLIPLSFLIVGPGEELLFRGLVQRLFRETVHPIRAIVLASALFASIHIFALSGDGKFVYLAIAFALGLVLGASYEYTGNLVVPAVIHGAHNAVEFAGAYLIETGSL